ncbi:hypothetical protein LEP1GSC064_3622 [Leptospira kirschneri serovar Grippotyphosa str. Moskva]|nr:hypothetical protein LEP1GSC064_3622 [Leptospira kirschneri serovar Grippotyphosa str. Moskva]
MCKNRMGDGSFCMLLQFQSLTVNPRFVRVPTSIFYEKIDLR